MLQSDKTADEEDTKMADANLNTGVSALCHSSKISRVLKPISELLIKKYCDAFVFARSDNVENLNIGIFVL